MNSWYLVVGKQGAKHTEPAYASLALAQAKQTAFNIEYPELGPWEMIPLAQFTEPNPPAQPVSQEDEE